MNKTSGNKEFATYITKYMGVGLIGGSVVHIGTLSGGATRYLLLGLVGVMLMVLGNMYETKRTGQKIQAKYFAIIFCLSLATGFLTGGIQHYADNPVYAGSLLSIGIFVSYVTYFLKEGFPLDRKNTVIVFLATAAFLIVSHVFVKDIFSSLHTTFEGSNTSAHSH